MCLWVDKSSLGMTFSKSFGLWKSDSKMIGFLFILIVVFILRLELIAVSIFQWSHALYL